MRTFQFNPIESQQAHWINKYESGANLILNGNNNVNIWVIQPHLHKQGKTLQTENSTISRTEDFLLAFGWFHLQGCVTGNRKSCQLEPDFHTRIKSQIHRNENILNKLKTSISATLTH